MRKTKEVKLTLLTVFVMSFASACSPSYREVRNCIDPHGDIVPDQNCDRSQTAFSGGYHYVYGASSGGYWGDRVYGGSFTPSSRATVVSGETGSIIRGGFGHSSSGGGE